MSDANNILERLQAERIETMLQHILTTGYIIGEWCRKSTFDFTEIVNEVEAGKSMLIQRH